MDHTSSGVRRRPDGPGRRPSGGLATVRAAGRVPGVRGPAARRRARARTVATSRPQRTRGGPRLRAALSRAAPRVAALVAAVPIAQASAAELGERTLERGDRGDDVRELQQLLTRLGPDTEADRVFGDGTVDQVEAYERREDLSVDGVVSPGQVH